MPVRRVLDPILRPRSIAVIGASRTPGTVGHELVANLARYGFAGPVYPVNPHAAAIRSIKAYPGVAHLPDPVDLAVVAVPKESVVSVAEDCGRKGIPGLVVISAGFREVGGEGAERERSLMEVVRRYRMRLVGPNCLGVLNTDPEISLNATFAPAMPPAGRVAFVSQSGALGLSVLDHAREYGIGIAQFASIGNRPDVSSNDLLLYWEDDPAVAVILMYVESFGNPHRFREIAARIGKRKPIVVVKSGRSRTGARAASSHTGALAGSDRAVEALLAQAGVLRAETVEELFELAIALGAEALPRSRRTAVITNSGGPGILAADALEARGLELPALSAITRSRLEAALPAEASLGNPVDMIATAPPAAYRAALDAVLDDPAVGSAIAIFVPPIAARQADVAEAIAQARPGHRSKPLLAVLMGREGLPQGRAELQGAGIPAYVFPESAARSLAAMVRQREWSEQPIEPVEALPVDRVSAARVLRVRDRKVLVGAEALSILEAYGVSTAPGRLATDSDGAVAIAGALGYPVVLKVVSSRIPHKTEIGGVRAGLRAAEDVRWAFAEIIASARRVVSDAEIDGVLVQKMAGPGRELIVGVARDPAFGPLVMFGIGGILAEALNDVVFRLAPLRRRDAAEMVRGIRGVKLLGEFRGAPPVDLGALEDVLLRVSQLARDFPELEELDVNPLLASEAGAVAVDARAVVGAPPGRSGPEPQTIEAAPAATRRSPT